MITCFQYVETVTSDHEEIKRDPQIMLKIKVGLSPSKKFFVICFNESPLKLMKNTFYFILKYFFILRLFNFL